MHNCYFATVSKDGRREVKTPLLALAVEQDFPRGVMEALLIQHPEEQGLSSFCWYMAADGSLVIYYPEAVLASYAAGAFTLTIPREDAPHLFTAAYPMD